MKLKSGTEKHPDAIIIQSNKCCYRAPSHLIRTKEVKRLKADQGDLGAAVSFENRSEHPQNCKKIFSYTKLTFWNEKEA